MKLSVPTSPNKTPICRGNIFAVIASQFSDHKVTSVVLVHAWDPTYELMFPHLQLLTVKLPSTLDCIWAISAVLKLQCLADEVLPFSHLYSSSREEVKYTCGTEALPTVPKRLCLFPPTLEYSKVTRSTAGLKIPRPSFRVNSTR